MATGGTKAQILSMGGAVIFERLIQFTIPLILVRVFAVDEFGYYKLFWLIVNSAMLIAPLGMPSSLMFFLPRSNHEVSRTYIYQTLFVLLVTGLLGALIVSPLNYYRPATVSGTPIDGYEICFFTVFWVLSSIIDILPSADQNVRWRVRSILFISLIRLILVSGTAIITKDLGWVIISLVAFSITKFLLLIYYTIRNYGFQKPEFSFSRLSDQLKYAIPFGFSGGLYNMRLQAEQWVVAVLFSAGNFAVFSVATSMVPLVEVLRRPVRQVLLPKMSRAHAEGNIQRVLELNNQGNMAVSFLLFPLLAFLFAFSEIIVDVLFTNTYSVAAQVLRYYIIGMMLLGVEISTVLIVFSQGKYVMKVSAALVLFSIIGSYSGAILFGLNGAVLGSVISLYIGSFMSFWRATRLMKVTISSIQDWKGLFVLAFSAILAALTAYWINNELIMGSNELLQLLIGITVITCIFICLIILLGYGWLIGAYTGRRKLNGNK